MPFESMGTETASAFDQLGTPPLLVLLVPFFATIVGTPIARLIALRFGIVDKPIEGSSKTHARTTPYLGGLAVFTALLVGSYIVLQQTSRILPDYFNIWLVLIALFVYIGASEEESATHVSRTLKHVRVGDIMTEDVMYTSPDTTISQLLDTMFETKHMGYPVSESEQSKGVPLSEVSGIVTFHDVRKVAPQDRDALLVRDVMTPNVITIPKDAHAMEALKRLKEYGIGRLVVVDNDEVVGIVSRTDLMRSVDILSLRV